MYYKYIRKYMKCSRFYLFLLSKEKQKLSAIIVVFEIQK